MLLGRLRNRLMDDYHGSPPEIDQSVPPTPNRAGEEVTRLSEGYDVEQNYQHQLSHPQQSIDEIVREQSEKEKSPLAILDEIKEMPTPKGTYPTVIGGRSVDLHVLEDYIVKISPYSLKTILRYNNARMIEEIKNYSRLGGAGKISSRFWILLLLGLGLAAVGVMIIFFMPQIVSMFSGMAGGVSAGGQ